MKNDSKGNLDICRETFTPISDEVKEVVKHFKLITNSMIGQLMVLRQLQSADSDAPRLFALAITHYELSCMWAVKALTSEGLKEGPWPGTTDTKAVEK